MMINWIQRQEQWCAPNYNPLPVVLNRGQGVWVWDTDGRRYLDMISGYSAVNHGHCHPKILSALIKQAGLLSVCSRACYNDKLGDFLATLCQALNMDMALPMNSGTEAVETAIKAVRRWGYRQKSIPYEQAEIIVTSQNSHGSTLGSMSLSTNTESRKDFGPLLSGFRVVPFGDAEALKNAINPNTCAVITEPLQGEAGILIPPSGWLSQVAQICHDHHILLVVDEVQSGLGRTGKVLACYHEDVQPDAVILGKSLGGGFLPVSALVGRRDLLSLLSPGSHHSTFGGNPLAAAVGLASLQVLKDEKLCERSAELGEYFLHRLRQIDSPYIQDIRGLGLWIAIEIDPKWHTARSLCEQLLYHGILAQDTQRTVIRLAPPLVMSHEEMNWALTRIYQVLQMGGTIPMQVPLVF